VKTPPRNPCSRLSVENSMVSIRRWTLAAALALAASTLPLIAQAAGSPVNASAPKFTLHTLDGKRLTLATFRGKTLVINVWGSWCPPCRLEMPDLVAESAADGPNVAFLGIDLTETPAVARAYITAKGVTYPQVVATAASAFAHDYDIRNYPTTIVIDPNGVVRARHDDNLLPRTQLHAFIVAAQQGRAAPLVSEEQRKLDAMLDPAQFTLAGDAATIFGGVLAVDRAISAAEDRMDDAMSDPARDHDLLKTHEEERTLRARAIEALQPVAGDASAQLLLSRLRGDQAVALGHWEAADAAYARALAIDPNDRAALSGQAYAASKRGDTARVAAIDRRVAALAPSYSTYMALTRAEAARGHRALAMLALDRAVAAAQEEHNNAHLAWVHLYGGRSAVVLGDRTRARSEFALAESAAERIDPRDVRRVMYLEQSQEATVALDLSDKHAPAGLSLAPWTGPDLPGSLASTIKYRLAVSGTSGNRVALNATGLPKGWIGSFCSDRLCSPFATTVVIPPSGIKLVEFQVVPPDASAHTVSVRIHGAAGGKSLADVAAVVRT
jgi:thiol-disulfide isomerase/thioredoxin/tetratricopeptide (TPR) repeat protein